LAGGRLGYVRRRCLGLMRCMAGVVITCNVRRVVMLGGGILGDVLLRVANELLATTRTAEEVFGPFVPMPVRGTRADLHATDGIRLRPPWFERQRGFVRVSVHDVFDA